MIALPEHLRLGIENALRDAHLVNGTLEALCASNAEPAAGKVILAVPLCRRAADFHMVNVKSERDIPRVRILFDRQSQMMPLAIDNARLPVEAISQVFGGRKESARTTVLIAFQTPACSCSAMC